MLLRYRLPADLITPLSAYLALRSHGASLLLESADQGERVGRHSFVLVQGAGEVKMAPPAHGWVQALRDLAGPILADRGTFDAASELPPGRDTMPVGVGIAGYVGFEAVIADEPTLQLPKRDSLGLPTVWARRFDAALVFDHLHQVAELQVMGDDEAALRQRLLTLRLALSQPVLAQEDAGSPRAFATIKRTEYEAHVHNAQTLIHDGDVYQLVPSQRLRIEQPPSPLTAYRRMRRLNPSPYGFLLEWNGFALAGASPEMLVRVSGGEAETLPIAGTVPRGGDDTEDAARFEALRSDPKELAEHQMLVDLARNDLGRCAMPGGVHVEKPLALQRTSHVLHLTTTVKARLRDGLDALDVLSSCFPAGTVSGAPKLRAAKRIAEMEGDARGPYAGALIKLGADGAFDSALILRTAVYANGHAWLQAGAGIVRASDAHKEYMETLHKLGAPATAMGVSLDSLEGAE
ncbi:MAG: anthranilate synthase component I family protein [Proteobacteria bacterium]|nr:anthranilate synthase component I family protein [Pseudomonadota bacterium]